VEESGGELESEGRWGGGGRGSSRVYIGQGEAPGRGNGRRLMALMPLMARAGLSAFKWGIDCGGELRP
jgi:hypothetical protein